MKRTAFWGWLRDRAREPSTWRGLLALLGVIGWKLRPDQQDSIVTAVIPLISALWIGEKSAPAGGGV